MYLNCAIFKLQCADTIRHGRSNMSDEKDSGMPRWLVEALTVGISLSPTLLLTINKELGDWLSSRTNNSLSIGTVLLLVIIAFLCVLVVRTRLWLRWDVPTGTWISRTNGFRYCEKCRSNRKSLSPLKNERTGWRCMSCQQFYFDPERASDPTASPRALIRAARPRI